MFRTLISFFVLVFLSQTAFAQTTGNVFGPSVKENERGWEYRIALDPESADGSTRVAQRFHYQQAINTRFRWRLVGQLRKTDDSDIDFDYLQAEMMWNFTPDDADYQSALRFDARLRDSSRAEQLAVNWVHQLNLGEGWRARAIAVSALQIGKTGSDGLGLQTRGQLSKKLSRGRAVGLEMFNIYGTTANVRDFEDQSHAIGPFYNFDINDTLTLSSRVLFGVTDGAADTDIRFALVKSWGE